MKTILVPTDYSKEARNAFVYALEIARLTMANIVVLHSFHRPIKVTDSVRIEDAVKELEKEENIILQEYAAEVKTDICKNFCLQFTCTTKNNPAIPQEEKTVDTSPVNQFHNLQEDKRVAEIAAIKVKCVSKLGWPADEIIKAAKTYKADLVVMGMRGTGAISQAFLGSTVAAVIQSCTVPVLALPGKIVFKGIKSIVFTSDLSQSPDKKILNLLREWVKIFNGQLQILHLYRQNNRQQAEKTTVDSLVVLDNQLFDLDYKIYFQQQEDVAAGILAFIQTHTTDLLVLVPNHHTFLEKLLQETVTGKIITNPFVPLLTLPKPAEHPRVANQDKLLKRQL